MVLASATISAGGSFCSPNFTFAIGILFVCGEEMESKRSPLTYHANGLSNRNAISCLSLFNARGLTRVIGQRCEQMQFPCHGKTPPNCPEFAHKSAACAGNEDTCSGTDDVCSGTENACSGMDAACSGMDAACSGTNEACSGTD